MKKGTKLLVAGAVVLALCAGALLVFLLPQGQGAPERMAGLQSAEGEQYYYDASGVQQYGWQIIDGKRYYFDPGTGAAVHGWFTDERGETYFFDESGVAVGGQHTIDGRLYNFDENGRMVADIEEAGFVWEVRDGNTYCVNPATGQYLAGRHQLFGSYYYFDASGARLGGLQNIDGKLYYFDPENGRAAKGWKTIDGKTYYFSVEGYALTGGQTIAGKPYTFDADGVLKPGGSAAAGGPSSSPSGRGGSSSSQPQPPSSAAPPASVGQPAPPAPDTGGKWEKDPGGNDVYRLADGSLARGIFSDGTGLVFTDPATGARKTGLQTDGVNTVYVDPATGYAVVNTWGEDPNEAGRAYYFGAQGLALKGMQTVGGALYHFDEGSGVRQNGLAKLNGKLYYFAGVNDCAVTGWHTVGGEKTQEPGGETPATEPQAPGPNAAIPEPGAEMRSPVGGTLQLRAGMPGLAAAAPGLRMLLADDAPPAAAQTYYFGSGFYALTGLQQITENGVSGWYGFDAEGAQLQGWQTFDGTWYLFSAVGGGARTNQWEIHPQDPSAALYLGADGGASKGLQEIGGQLYCFDTEGKRQKGILSADGNWYNFAGKDDAAVVSAWYEADGVKIHYFGADGKAYVGPQEVAGARYLFGPDAVMLTGWQEYGGKTYFLAEDGTAAVNTWKEAQGETAVKTYYLGGDGAALTGLQTIDKATYFFGATGLREGGWKTVGGRLYLFDGPQQQARTGAHQQGAGHYLFGGDGAAQSGLQKVDGAWYYYQAGSFLRQSGWQKANGFSYFFSEETGRAQTGWFTDVKSGGVYHFDAEGRALTGAHKIDGVDYQFESTGRLQPGGASGADNWVVDGGRTYFVDENGNYVTGLLPLDGALYYFAADGTMQTGLVEHTDGRYYFGEDGKAVGGDWRDIGGARYYFGTDGKAYTGIRKVGDGLYWFSASGAMQTGETTQGESLYFFDGANGGKAAAGWYPQKSPAEGQPRYYDKATFAAAVGPHWIDDGGGKQLYFFDDAGRRMSGWQTDENGLRYYLGGEANAALRGGFYPLGESTYYFTENGDALTGLRRVPQDGPLYAFDASGAQLFGRQAVQGNIYFFDAENGGAALTGEHTLGDGATYYFHDTDAFALTGIHYFGGRTYVFTPDGHLVSKEATEGFAWKYENERWYYVNSAGETPGTGIVPMADGIYYFLADGSTEAGFKTVEGYKYFFGVHYAEDRGRAAVGWYQAPSDGASYYFDEEGRALTGYHEDINGLAYDFNEDGTLKEGYQVPIYNEWRTLGDGRCYYDATGKMATGLRYIEEGTLDGVTIGRGWYFFDETGRNVNGWQTDGAYHYYFDTGGFAAVTGWQEIGGKWYLFDGNTARQQVGWQFRPGEGGAVFTHYYDVTSGAAPEGWSSASGDMRYFFADGHMAIGWQDLPDGRYYFYQTGERAVGVVTVDEQLYSFDAEGRALSGWNRDGDNKRYYFEEGAALSGWRLLPENAAEGAPKRWYYFDENNFHQRLGWQVRPAENGNERFYYYSDGSLPPPEWQTISGRERYVFPDGHIAIGWQVLPDGGLYYFGDQGQVTKGPAEVGGIQYPFDENGRLALGWHPADGGSPRYYYTGQGAATGWMEIDGVWYVFDENTGTQKTGWQARAGEDGQVIRHYYHAAGGVPAGWTELGGARYYFHPDGSAAGGWTEIDKLVYYFLPQSGKMATGVVKIDGAVYSFGEDGQMLQGWNWGRDGQRYYITEDGALRGWNSIDGRWYHLDEESGAQRMGWQARAAADAGSQTRYYMYYYYENGALPAAGWRTDVPNEQGVVGAARYILPEGQAAQSWVAVGGARYCFDAYGAALLGWQQVHGRWYNLGDTGAQRLGWQQRVIGEGYAAEYYYFADGSLPAAGWNSDIENTRRYVMDDGEMARGLLSVAGDTYYFEARGVPAAGERTIGGKVYRFDAQGRYVSPPVLTGVSLGGAWSNGQTNVIVQASASAILEDRSLQYSFTGGAAWSASGEQYYPAGTVVPAGTIQVRDSIGNIVSFDAPITMPSLPAQTLRGIDISAHQGYIDWAAVKASGQVDFAIIRSLCWSRAKGYYDIDPYFDYNVRTAKAFGIKVGAYLYSYAFNDAEMAVEIQYFLNSSQVQGLIRDGITFDLPVFIDYEDPLIATHTAGQSIAQRTQTVRYGMVLTEQLSGYRYTPGFYVNRNWALNMISAATLQNEGYDLWLARWGVSAHGWGPAPPLWQYSNGSYGDIAISGIAGTVDRNWLYTAHLASSKAGGGFAPSTPPVSVETPPASPVPAVMTVRNQYGNTVSGPANDILAQIVMAEVGGFGNAEVYKAQAVAAQSWLQYREGQGYAVSGVALATPTQAVRDAVNQVMGQRLYYGGAVAMTPYYAYGNGMTNDAKYWNAANNFPYLVPVTSAYDAAVKAPYYGTISEAQMRAQLVATYGDYLNGYLDSMHPSEWVKITGRNAGSYVSGLSVCGHRTPGVEYFYLTILPYTAGGSRVYPVASADFDISYANGVFTFTNRGYGHCIGLSQYGAYGMAVNGASYTDILAHYFPGTQLVQG